MKDKYVNKKLCVQDGLSDDISSKAFLSDNENYYKKIEKYDWVRVVDKHLGLESVLHSLREKKTVELVKIFGLEPKFLDAGCGTGLILRHLVKGSVGLDINPRNISKAKVHAPKAKLVEGKINKMPFAKNRFTTVICTEVLEHLPDPTKAISEIARVLAPGGILIGSVPGTNPIWRLRFLSSTHPGEPYHKIYIQDDIKALFKKSWKILYLKRNCFLMNIFFVVRKNG
jgi:ubiquinone/menaquinone biosynthesis C-methylase UbiE